MLVAGSISELIGRKKTLILGQIFMIIGWVVIYFAQNFLTLLVGRFIIGIGIGIGLPVTTLQLSEMALIKMRGILSMMGYLVMNIGCVFSLIIAANFSLNILILLCCAPSVAFLVVSILLPESPVWLMKKGRNT